MGGIETYFPAHCIVNVLFSHMSLNHNVWQQVLRYWFLNKTCTRLVNQNHNDDLSFVEGLDASK